MEKWLESFARANFLRGSDTAHDLKTPLNVAVLNLELLRMRIRSLNNGADDPKVRDHSAAIEMELRRMARIVDTFFLLSIPPKDEGVPAAVDVSAICSETAQQAGIPLDNGGPAFVIAHESRIRQAFRLFFESVLKLFAAGGLRAAISSDSERISLTVAGVPAATDFEPTRIFKFYYTDPLGNPDLAMATARLIVETYGGELTAAAVEESDKVIVRLSLPPR
jgi:signal transduction histidine kinase